MQILASSYYQLPYQSEYSVGPPSYPGFFCKRGQFTVMEIRDTKRDNIFLNISRYLLRHEGFYITQKVIININIVSYRNEDACFI